MSEVGQCTDCGKSVAPTVVRCAKCDWEVESLGRTIMAIANPNPSTSRTRDLILAVDPGTSQSGVVLYCGGRVVESGVHPNAAVLETIRVTPADVLAIERFEARGMAVGDESIQTILWAGRFQQAWRSPESVVLVKRSAVKSHLCGTQKAKDSNVRQALIDLLGAPGTKASPGATYGVSSHAWAALAVAVTAEAA